MDTELAAAWGGPVPEDKKEILDIETAAKSIVAVIDTPPSLLVRNSMIIMVYFLSRVKSEFTCEKCFQTNEASEQILSI